MSHGACDFCNCGGVDVVMLLGETLGLSNGRPLSPWKSRFLETPSFLLSKFKRLRLPSFVFLLVIITHTATFHPRKHSRFFYSVQVHLHPRRLDGDVWA